MDLLQRRRELMMMGKLPYDAEVEWLLSTSGGRQYIDTGIEPLFTDEIGATIYTDMGCYGTSFGCKNTNEIAVVPVSSGVYVKFFTTGSAPLFAYTVPAEGSQRAEIVINYKNGLETITKPNGTSSQSIGYNTPLGSTLTLFTRKGVAGYGIIAFGKFFIKRNDLYILDFIPVRVGTTGYMYDKVSKQLFGNAGEGAFLFGNDIT